MKGDREKCYAAGCGEYLSKPIDNGELYRLLAKYLRRDVSLDDITQIPETLLVPRPALPYPPR